MHGTNGTPKKKIGLLLKAARQKRGLTADQVAERCEVCRSRVYMWEGADYVFPGPRGRNFRKLSKVLNIPITKLRDANGQRPV